jgi:hypothetical protein
MTRGVTPFKVVVDCADPHRMAAFWSEALGYVVEDNGPLIRRLLDAGRIGEGDVERAGDGYRFARAAAVRNPEDAFDDATGIGRGGRILFQAVPEPKTVKNRVHLDLHVGPDRRDAEVARLTALGARVLWEGEQGGRWTTMADPEGNEFCVA